MSELEKHKNQLIQRYKNWKTTDLTRYPHKQKYFYIRTPQNIIVHVFPSKHKRFYVQVDTYPSPWDIKSEAQQKFVETIKTEFNSLSVASEHILQLLLLQEHYPKLMKILTDFLNDKTNFEVEKISRQFAFNNKSIADFEGVDNAIQ